MRCRIPSRDADVRVDVARLGSLMDEALDLAMDRRDPPLSPYTRARWVSAKYVFYGDDASGDSRSPQLQHPPQLLSQPH